MKYRKQPYMTRARFNSVCPETGKAIGIGDEIAYYPDSRKAYHTTSTHADTVRALEFSRAWAMSDANY
jgi:hypothetical protein